MTTQFYYPKTITEYGEQNDIIQPLIEWNINGTLSPDNPITSKKPLYTISGLWMEKFLSHTNELWCSNFNIPDRSQQVGTQITGIEAWNWHSFFPNPYAWIPSSNPVFMSLYAIGPSIVGWTFYSANDPSSAVTITAREDGSVLEFSADPGSAPYIAQSPDYSPAVPYTVVGIEVYLDVHRLSRIEDLRIQLRLNDDYIGDNMASPVDPVQSNMYTGENSPLLPIVGNKNVYRSSTEVWGTELTSADVADDSFGVAISFRSNQVYPHRDLVIVNQIGIGITYG
jgi:hypothetical protein